jgi:hypothetical protein
MLIPLFRKNSKGPVRRWALNEGITFARATTITPVLLHGSEPIEKQMF